MHLKLRKVHFFLHICKKKSNFAALFNRTRNMRFVALIVWALVIILAIYYATVITHLFTNLFGKNVDFKKTLIPFYGWTIWLKNI